MRRSSVLTGLLSILAFTLPACVEAEVEDGENDGFPSGKADGGLDEGSAEALGVLALVNDGTLTAPKLKAAAGITTRVSTNIVKHRDGADSAVGTTDDDLFDTLAELDAIPYVGPATLNALLEAARDRGLVGGASRIEVLFSPQPVEATHMVKVASMIRAATTSVDIAMYSYSDAKIGAALADAVARGVKVRFLFETGNDDRKILDATARAASKSGRLEAAGIDVRYVNKILHHKFLIVDGPRDDAARAATAKLATGSANWSSTAGTVFDENTLFVEGSPKLSAAFQHEFDILWRGSRDFVGPAPAQGQSTANITVDQVPDEVGTNVLFTSPNFTPTGADGTTWSVDKNSTVVADVWVDAIERAQTSIHIASGHLRLRSISEALIAKKQANPSFDIKVYLDQQEFISTTGHNAQVAEVAECLATATTPNATRDCKASNFLFSRALVDAGIDVRFKSYAYRWDHSYAAQMHSKYMVIDGKELFSGSYNLSMNAEQATFENALHLSGPQYAGLLAAFESNFTNIWRTGPTLLAPLRTQISTSPTIPLVFPSMSLSYAEFESLRALIRTNCTVADSAEYRSNATAHRSCPR